ncbi:hypothetical protein [Nocardia fluminea]|uniref:hypothetical protein n=1 Tax=Nocardia fluminea TaxID=134984 RepID=UPI00341F64F7
MNESEPIHDLAHGDVAKSRQLSVALRTIMNASADPALENQIRAILEGRGSARDLMHSEAFNTVLDQTMPSAIQQFADMPEEERQRLAAQGEQQLERLRNQPPESFTPFRTGETTQNPVPAPEATQSASPSSSAVHPGTRKPNRERIVAPDEPDEDDLYFEDRRNRGWLV